MLLLVWLTTRERAPSPEPAAFGGPQATRSPVNTPIIGGGRCHEQVMCCMTLLESITQHIVRGLTLGVIKG